MHSDMQIEIIPALEAEQKEAAVRLQLRGSVLRTGEEPPQRYVLQRTEVFV